VKALVKARPEPGLWLEDVQVPTPGDDDVLIRVRKTSICGTDLHIHRWDAWAQATVPVPMVVGHEFMGEIVELGADVVGLEVGQRVAGEGHITCGHCRNCKGGRREFCHNHTSVGVTRPGAFAEYVVIPAENVFVVPAHIDDNVAAVLDPLGNATHTSLRFDVVGEDVLKGSEINVDCDKHIVIVLDQFERIVDGFPETENGRRQLAACLAALADCAGSNMSFVCVGVETVMYFKALTKTPYGYIEIPRLSHRLVGPIISRLARHAGIEFQPDVIRKIVSLYKETTFTLAHIQAVCNFLASSAHVDMASFDNVLQNERDALDVALNVHEIVSRVEDIPDDAGGRNLFRKVMKIIPHESKKFLARHLHENFADLLEPPETPAGRAV
jgi:hypothetical protein